MFYGTIYATTCFTGCNNPPFTYQWTGQMQLSGDCYINIWYGYRTLICDGQPVYEITILGFIGVVDSSCPELENVSNLLEAGILRMLVDPNYRPLTFPYPDTPNECVENVNVTGSACWQIDDSQGGPSERHYVSCDNSPDCCKRYTICMDENYALVVSENEYDPVSCTGIFSDDNEPCLPICE